MNIKLNGVKNTRKRNMIIDLLRSSNTPLSAEDIYLKLKAKNISVWVSTVYRTLTLLEDRGLVNKDNILGGGKAFYELRGKEHKHHLVCVGCKKVVSITGCPIKDYGKSLSKRTGFEVTGHKVEIYGLCAVCKNI